MMAAGTVQDEDDPAEAASSSDGDDAGSSSRGEGGAAGKGKTEPGASCAAYLVKFTAPASESLCIACACVSAHMRVCVGVYACTC